MRPPPGQAILAMTRRERIADLESLIQSLQLTSSATAEELQLLREGLNRMRAAEDEVATVKQVQPLQPREPCMWEEHSHRTPHRRSLWATMRLGRTSRTPCYPPRLGHAKSPTLLLRRPNRCQKVRCPDRLPA